MAVRVSSLITSLQLILAFNGAVEGYSHLKRTAGSGYYHLMHKPAPKAHLSIYNGLQAPMTVLNYTFKARSNFRRIEHAQIQGSSWDRFDVSGLRSNQEIYGFIELEIKENGHSIPIALYFNIPCGYPWQLPWYGIEMYTHKPENLLEAAGKLSRVSLANTYFRKFAYLQSGAMISVGNSQGLTLTAFMCRTWMNHFAVKFYVYRTRSGRPITITTTKRPIIKHTTRATTLSTTRAKATTTKKTTATPMITTTTKTTTKPTTITTTTKPTTTKPTTTTTTTKPTTTKPTTTTTTTKPTTTTTETTTEFDYPDPDPEVGANVRISRY